MKTDWQGPLRPAIFAEQVLIRAILDGEFPTGSTLPAERELAVKIGVTRPTLREALQRLDRDGWLTIQQGKSTRVNDFWREGGLNVLSAIVRFGEPLPEDFIPNLLEVRQALAPAYTRQAVELEPQRILDCLEDAPDLTGDPQHFAHFDWQLHHTLTVASGNPIYTLILNGFAEFYVEMALLYFNPLIARRVSAEFYQALSLASQARNGQQAYEITSQTMQTSIELWKNRQT